MKLKELIAARGLKHSWLASAIGLEHARLSLILAGLATLPIYKVCELAALLCCSVETLVRAHMADWQGAAARREARAKRHDR